MNIFKSYTYKWWQMGIFKLALLAIGILIGSYWSVFWAEFTGLLIAVAVIGSIYMMSASLRQ